MAVFNFPGILNTTLGNGIVSESSLAPPVQRSLRETPAGEKYSFGDIHVLPHPSLGGKRFVRFDSFTPNKVVVNSTEKVISTTTVTVDSGDDLTFFSPHPIIAVDLQFDTTSSSAVNLSAFISTAQGAKDKSVSIRDGTKGFQKNGKISLENRIENINDYAAQTITNFSGGYLFTLRLDSSQSLSAKISDVTIHQARRVVSFEVDSDGATDFFGRSRQFFVDTNTQLPYFIEQPRVVASAFLRIKNDGNNNLNVTVKSYAGTTGATTSGLTITINLAHGNDPGTLNTYILYGPYTGTSPDLLYATPFYISNVDFTNNKITVKYGGSSTDFGNLLSSNESLDLTVEARRV